MQIGIGLALCPCIMRQLHLFTSLSFLLLFFVLPLQAQIFKDGEGGEGKDKKEKRIISQQNRGLIIGYERGKYDFLQLGYGFRWKKWRLSKPVTRAADGIIGYAPFDNSFIAKASYWQRIGRLKATYGGHIAYQTDFTEQAVAAGPVIGFRLAGLHAQLGYLYPSNPDVLANRLFISLNLTFPNHTKIVTRKGDKKKRLIRW